MQPARVKFSKTHKGRDKKFATRGTKLSYGTFGLKSEENYWLKSNQIESAKKVMMRFIARGGKIWVRVFPDKPRTSNGGTKGMGGGRGALSHFVAPVEPGRVLFELDGLSPEIARQALRLGAHKLPIKTRIISR